jgi:hypothetical protein
MSIATLTATELRKAATIKEKIEELNNELVKILGQKVDDESPVERMSKRGRRKMSAAGRARIAAAAKARWAKVKAAGKKHL